MSDIVFEGEHTKANKTVTGRRQYQHQIKVPSVHTVFSPELLQDIGFGVESHDEK